MCLYMYINICHCMCIRIYIYIHTHIYIYICISNYCSLRGSKGFPEGAVLKPLRPRGLCLSAELLSNAFEAGGLQGNGLRIEHPA